MQAFTTSHKDPLTAAAASILFNEDLSTVKDKIKELKVGDKTNFGVVTKISDSSIEFKARDTGKTTISLNQRKMGSKDFVLDKLMKLAEEVEDLDEAKAADPANLRSIIANHTALLGKATEPEAKTFHKTAIANAKEKLKSLGEEVELDEETKTYRIFARFNNKNAKGVWQKINWSTEASSKEEAEAKFRKRMGKDIIKDLEITEGSCEDDEDTIEEGINFAAVAAAKKAGMSDAAIDSYVKIHKANGATDKEISAALLSGKAMKKEGVCEDDEDEDTIEEGASVIEEQGPEYNTKSPAVKKIIDQIDKLNGGETLDFWKSLQQLAWDLGGDDEDSSESWTIIASLLVKIIKEYQLHIKSA